MQVKKQDPTPVLWLMMLFGGAFFSAAVAVVFWYISQLNYWVFW